MNVTLQPFETTEKHFQKVGIVIGMEFTAARVKMRTVRIDQPKIDPEDGVLTRTTWAVPSHWFDEYMSPKVGSIK
jgi:hypothetical protein